MNALAKTLIPAMLLVATVHAHADERPMKDMPMGTSSQAQTHHAGGMVKKLDAAEGTVTLAHGPVKSLNWPPMTMGFRVRDKALLERLEVGKEVEFVKEGSDYVVTGIR